MNIPNITLEIYLDNVQMYLQALDRTCDHFVWQANTCPLANKYKQTPESILKWNTAVFDMIVKTAHLLHKTSYVNVYNASINFKHMDNIHMSPEWYKTLGAMYVNLINYGKNQ